jgi:hypothetical protein
MKNEQLRLADYIPQLKPVIKFKSKYLQWKYDNNYREADSKDKCCGNCEFHFAVTYGYNAKIYHKCDVMGVSNCSATDIRVGHICDCYMKFEGIKINENH